jgi:hypothetical protein
MYGLQPQRCPLAKHVPLRQRVFLNFPSNKPALTPLSKIKYSINLRNPESPTRPIHTKFLLQNAFLASNAGPSTIFCAYAWIFAWAAWATSEACWYGWKEQAKVGW